MRELHTIEVDKWIPSEKKPGMLQHAGMISPQEAFDVLKKHLEEVNMLPDEYFLSNVWDWKDVKEIPNFIRASCDVNWGGSEGIYLDISLLYRDENQQLQHFNFATGKTLDDSGDAFLRMSRIAAECSMMLNGRGEIVRIHEDELTREQSVQPDLSPLYPVMQEVMDKQKTVLAEVAEFLGAVQGEQIGAFEKKYGVAPTEILSDSAFFTRVVAEKQRLYDEHPNIFGVDNDPIKIALHNVCLSRQESLHEKRMAELRQLKVKKEKEENKFVFDDELCVQDKNLEVVDGYLWAMDALVSRLPSPHDDLENINFYPEYNVKTGEVKITASYDTPIADGETHKSFDVPLSADEKVELVSKMEAYCVQRNGVSCRDLVNEVRILARISLLGDKEPLNQQIAVADSKVDRKILEPSVEHIIDK